MTANSSDGQGAMAGPLPLKRGRPPKPRWPLLRGAILAPHRPRPVWTEDLVSPCDRFGLTQLLGCDDCGGKWWRAFPCTRVDCPRCAGRVAARRAKRCYERFGAPELGICVVTFPAEWRAFLSNAVLLEAEMELRKALQSWATQYLGGVIGGRTWWHPCGDLCECGEGGKELGLLGKCGSCGKQASYKPHINFAIPGAVLTPAGEVQSRHLFLGKRQLRGLRNAVAEVLQGMAEALGKPLPQRPRLPRELELELELELAELRSRPGSRDTRPRIFELEELLEDQGGPVINVFWEYRKEKEKKQHALRYFGRPFPAWELPHSGRDFGLLAGQGERQQLYRAAIRTDAEDAEVIKCPCCGADAWARMMPKEDSWKYRQNLPSWDAATARVAASVA